MKEKPKWHERETPAANARIVLPPLVTAWFAEVRRLMSHRPSPEKLHKVRLATKRIRYTLELFRPCYGPGLEMRLSELRQLQQFLGDINDCAAASRLIKRVSKVSMHRAEAQQFLKRRAAQQAAQFRKHWSTVFDVPGTEHRWTTYLSRRQRGPSRGRRRA